MTAEPNSTSAIRWSKCTERIGLIPLLPGGLPQPDERDELEARSLIHVRATGVLGSGLDVPGQYLP